MNALPPRRGPGRPRSPSPETPAARIARLTAELEAAQIAAREEADRQAAIVGRSVLARMAKEPAFCADMLARLREDVTAKQERAAIAALLGVEGAP